MNTLTAKGNHILSMSDGAIAKVRELEADLLSRTQVLIPTDHILHGGMYSRTIVIPAGVAITGTLLKIATLLIISGDMCLYVDGVSHRMTGYNVFAGSAQRKQAGFAITDTAVTMIFKTDAKTVAEAEEEFTDEHHLLWSRADGAVNNIIFTGE